MSAHTFSQSITIDQAVSLLVLGDSYSIGESVQTSERWPQQLTDEFRRLGINAGDPYYIATTGWTTGDLINGIKTDPVKARRYNLVSILIGVNNQYQGKNISIYEPELKIIIDYAMEVVNQDQSRIMILSIPDYAFTPFGEGKESISKEIDAYNTINRRLAESYGISYIDITPISRTGLEKTSLVAGDGLHPSAEQYGEWVKKIIPQCKIPVPPNR
ncbi:MAG: SGNH/GDSL hydrolase family protein [Bacteroidetes bacterium]|nr:SGNH/GDSL hydrolase family protein [Bacteroidota bacterium]